MEQDKIMEYFLGKNVLLELKKNGDDFLCVNGETRELILNNWKIKFSNTELNNDIPNLVSVFDCIYNQTDAINIGVMVDFNYNEVILYFENLDDCLKSNKNIIKEIKNSNLSNIIYTSAIHKGSVMISNWGASKRFKRMLLGYEVDYCKAMNEIAFSKHKKVVISEAIKKSLPQDKYKITKIDALGIVGGTVGHIYQITI